MAFQSPQQTPSFLPPAPPARTSRAGGIFLLLGGALAAISIWLPWSDLGGEQMSLWDIYSFINESGVSAADDPTVADFQINFFAILGGGVIAVIFGLIAAAVGKKGANLTAGIFGILAALSAGFPPIRTFLETTTMEGAGIGFWASLVAPVIILLGAIIAFVGSAKR